MRIHGQQYPPNTPIAKIGISSLYETRPIGAIYCIARPNGQKQSRPDHPGDSEQEMMTSLKFNNGQ